jgi:A/G-specific adenine glycosylase
VLRIWSGLGYNRRALNLHRAAKAVMEEHGGRLPETVEELRKMPGIGPYSAAAIACFGLGQQVAMVDVNVQRVLSRILWGDESPRPPKQVAALAQEALPEGRAEDWNQALMDLGATVCVARVPRCLICPARDVCLLYAGYVQGAQPVRKVAERQAPYVGSRRYYRGRVVEALRGATTGEGLTLADLGPSVKTGFSAEDMPWLTALVEELAKEGMVDFRDGRAALPG